MSRVRVFQMPHESTTDPEDIKFQKEEEELEQSKTRSRSLPADTFNRQQSPAAGSRPKALSLVAETPKRITHHHDDDDDDDSPTAPAYT